MVPLVKTQVFCMCMSHTTYYSVCTALIWWSLTQRYLFSSIVIDFKGTISRSKTLSCVWWQDQGVRMIMCSHLLHEIYTHCSFSCHLLRWRPHSAVGWSVMHWQVVFIRKVIDTVKHPLKGDIAPRRLSGQSHEVYNNFFVNIVSR